MTRSRSEKITLFSPAIPDGVYSYRDGECTHE